MRIAGLLSCVIAGLLVAKYFEVPRRKAVGGALLVYVMWYFVTSSM
jgi:hypothetical protein